MMFTVLFLGGFSLLARANAVVAIPMAARPAEDFRKSRRDKPDDVEMLFMRVVFTRREKCLASRILGGAHVSKVV